MDIQSKINRIRKGIKLCEILQNCDSQKIKSDSSSNESEDKIHHSRRIIV